VRAYKILTVELVVQSSSSPVLRRRELTLPLSLSWLMMFLSMSSLCCLALSCAIVSCFSLRAVCSCRVYNNIFTHNMADTFWISVDIFNGLHTATAANVLSHTHVPATWNSLPDNICAVADPEEFRQQPEDARFTSAFLC